MGRKQSRAQLAARGTSADPNARVTGEGTGEPAPSGGRGSSKATPGAAGRRKLHGVITEDYLKEQVERTGTYPFTFSSSIIIAVSALLGAVVIPYLAEIQGLDARAAGVCALSVLVPCALAGTRYFLDSDRGVCRGLWVTLGVSFAAVLLVSYLLYFKGVSVL